jgi:hypothetical protein
MTLALAKRIAMPKVSPMLGPDNPPQLIVIETLSQYRAGWVAAGSRDGRIKI